MKSLNDSLREEFKEILKEHECLELIQKHSLDHEIINEAYEILLENKENAQTEDHINNSRQKFQNYILNTLKFRNDYK